VIDGQSVESKIVLIHPSNLEKLRNFISILEVNGDTKKGDSIVLILRNQRILY
jgi:hypothetical protein